MITIFAALIAVLGTLGAVAVTGTVGLRTAAAARAHATAESRRFELLNAVTALAAALADHRGAMWFREKARIDGAKTSALESLSDRVHETRSALTVPATAIAILSPVLRAYASTAMDATYRMRHASSLEMLGQLRGEALKAANALVTRTTDELPA